LAKKTQKRGPDNADNMAGTERQRKMFLYPSRPETLLIQNFHVAFYTGALKQYNRMLYTLDILHEVFIYSRLHHSWKSRCTGFKFL